MIPLGIIATSKRRPSTGGPVAYLGTISTTHAAGSSEIVIPITMSPGYSHAAVILTSGTNGAHVTDLLFDGQPIDSGEVRLTYSSSAVGVGPLASVVTATAVRTDLTAVLTLSLWAIPGPGILRDINGALSNTPASTASLNADPGDLIIAIGKTRQTLPSTITFDGVSVIDTLGTGLGNRIVGQGEATGQTDVTARTIDGTNGQNLAVTAASIGT